MQNKIKNNNITTTKIGKQKTTTLQPQRQANKNNNNNNNTNTTQRLKGTKQI